MCEFDLALVLKTGTILFRYLAVSRGGRKKMGIFMTSITEIMQNGWNTFRHIACTNFLLCKMRESFGRLVGVIAPLLKIRISKARERERKEKKSPGEGLYHNSKRKEIRKFVRGAGGATAAAIRIPGYSLIQFECGTALQRNFFGGRERVWKTSEWG